jgi:hypothetical protein
MKKCDGEKEEEMVVVRKPKIENPLLIKPLLQTFIENS